MLSILASGALTADPRERTTTAGKPYATCTMRVPCEDGEPMLISVIAFAPDVVQAILALGKGDAVSISGRAKLTSWTKDGEQRHGLSVVVDRVLTAYAVGKQRKAAREYEEAAA